MSGERDFAAGADEELVRRLGVFDDARDIAPPPVTMMDWARRWVTKHKLYVFPALRGLGRPHIETWSTIYGKAKDDEQSIIAWWSQWPDADIGAIPSRSGHFVISAEVEKGGLDSLDDIEAEFGNIETVFPRYTDHWGNVFLWCKGRAVTSHHKVARGIHVIGPGLPVYLPNSGTPHLDYTIGGE